MCFGSPRLRSVSLTILVILFLIPAMAQTKKTNTPAPAKKINTIDTISISIVGDLMVGSSYPSSVYLPPDSEGNILSYAIPTLSKTDLRIGNLEGAIADTVHVFKDCGDGKNCYAFRTPCKEALWYKQAGFNYLNLSNNHSYDFGPNGSASTVAFLSDNNIRTSGILQHPFDTITVRHTVIGFLSFAPHKNCLDLNNDSLVTSYVRQVRGLCDVLVVFFHGGAEGASRMHVPEGHELFYEQDRGDIIHFTHLCIDEGADLVIGSGPHVVRGMEFYNGKLIAYSLGNFATYHLFNLKPPMNVAPLLRVRITSKGELVSTRVVSFKQKGEGIPVPDDKFTAYKMLKELSSYDFCYNHVLPAKAVLPGHKKSKGSRIKTAGK